MSEQQVQRAEHSPAEATASPDADSVRAINQRIFETSLDLILVVDRKGNFIRVSPSCEAILGYRPEHMVGHSAAEFLYPADLESTREEMRMARRGRLMRHFECRYVHKNGRVVMLAWTGVWSEAEQQHFFIGRDMTERIKLENQLRQAQKMEAIGQLTGGIAHDFNNLLSVVIGSIELMFDDPDLSREAAEHGRNAMHAAQRGAELTRRLLAFARQQSLVPKVLDANELLGNFTRLLRQTVGQHIEVEFSGARELWPVFIDAAHLESAIANLSVNARDAMPNGGRLLIETQNVTVDGQFLRDDPDAVPGDYVAVIVTDTGTGMPPEVLEHIFEPFFTTKEQGKGTGLGLAMVYGFVKQSGGYLKAYSEVGHGTSFRLFLPRAKTPAAAEGAGPSGPRAQPGRQERVLVVEDNEAIRQVVLIQLAKLGYKAIDVSGPAAALKLIDAGEPFDLLFTDVVMPGGMTGLDLAREATARRPHLKVLFTSGFPGALVSGRDGAIESDSVLGKPYSLKELAQKLRIALDR